MAEQKNLRLLLTVFFLVPAATTPAIENQMAQAFVGGNLNLRSPLVVSHQPATGEFVLLFPARFSMSIGANQFSGDKAVIWIDSRTVQFRGRLRVDYDVTVYITGNLSEKKGRAARAIDITKTTFAKDEAVILQFAVDGEIFVSVDKKETSDPAELELYKKALSAKQSLPSGPAFVVQSEALVPPLPEEEAAPAVKAAKKARLEKEKPGVPEKVEEEIIAEKPPKRGLAEKVFGPKKAAPAAVPAPKEPTITYPVLLFPAGPGQLQWESAKAPDGTDIATVIGRFYLSHKLDEAGALLELQADNAVIFYSTDQPATQPASLDQAGLEELVAKSVIKAVYMSGNVVLTEGARSIRCDEIYYDFQNRKAIAVNAVMRTYDTDRGIPIYVRAAKLRQLAQNKFAAENITMTTSEFHEPQISLNASSILITDTTTVDQQAGKVSDSSYDAQMRDITMKLGKTTIFYWPKLRSNLERPDVPLQTVHVGRDNTWGTSVESRWYLARLLGLREPAGTDSILEVDYYSKRGLGTGAEIEYETEECFGRMTGYIIDDRGEDRLGRLRDRKHLKPDGELRGRFRWQHRQFLPYDWQLTTETSYASDTSFLESYYRGEFNTGKEQETLVHLKRIQDNWALAFLGKARITDFSDTLEEMPSGQFHLTGQSLLDDTLTLYSDSEVGRLRQRVGNHHPVLFDEDVFTFAAHRTELDLPLRADPFKIVPYAAGTFGFDDRSGFTRSLVDGTRTGEFGEKDVYIGEAGLRASTQFWKAFPNVKSRLWDLNQLRHIVEPYLTAVAYTESDSVVEQHDAFHVGLSQRLQTKRGPAENLRTVDWMRLDTDFTFVSNTEDGAGPDRFIWNRPAIPMRVMSAPEIFNDDLRRGLQRVENWGPRRNYFGADYAWRVSDTFAVLSDMYFDLQSSVVQQFNAGFTHLRWPNLSYYLGTRYLRGVEVLDEKGSNAVVFAASYILDPRYTIVFSQQYDFDYEATIRSDISLIRRYHRIFCAITYSADQSLDQQAIVFSIWPQGLPEMALGPRRYTSLGGPGGY